MAGLIVLIIYALFGMYLFHQIFTVYYFNLGNGLLKEFMAGIIFGAACIWLWWAADIALVILAIKAYKDQHKSLFGVCIVFIIMTTFLGILMRVTGAI